MWFVAFILIQIFHQLMKDLGYVLEINTQHFELTIQKDAKCEGCVVLQQCLRY